MHLNPLPAFAIVGLLAIPVSSRAHDHEHEPAGLEFHENKGQWPAQVLYRAKTGAGAVFVEGSALTYLVTSGGVAHGRSVDPAKDAAVRGHAYRVHFEGGRAGGHQGLERKSHYVNYFLGSDPKAWASNVAVYPSTELFEVYPGIDLHLDGRGGLKYEWLLKPGADPAEIVLRFEGQDALRVADGLLYVSTSAGQVIEQRPVAWQVRNGKNVPVRCNYERRGERISYDLPDGYDATLPLVIDPTVVFSSFTGSFGDNFGFTATYDESGHLYGGGVVFAAGYPVTLGALQPGFAGSSGSGSDIGISKFSPDGSSLIWSTYLGGSQSEAPHSLVVNSSDELYVLGTTNSTDFPVTTGCYDNTFGGGSTPLFGGGSYGFTYTGGTDIIVAHFNSSATALVGATFVGGAGNDGINELSPTSRNYGDPFRGEIVLDATESAIIATSTSSVDLFTTAGTTQSTNAGSQDGYVFRIEPGLAAISWASYYGGSGVDAGYGVQVSSAGEIYLTGGTTSANLPAAGTGAFPAALGDVDGFIARFAPAGSPLLSTTYLGTASYDQSYFVQLDVDNEVYVVGQTTGNYPVTPGKYANVNATQFIHKFSSDLSASLWSTRIGGNGGENLSITAFLVSVCDEIFFSAWGGTTNQSGLGGVFSTTLGLTVTPDAFQGTTDGSDLYLIVLESEAVGLSYATFFGGNASEHVDGGTSRFDKNGIVYQAVCAGCGGLGFPTTPGAYSTSNNSGNCNLGVFKLDFQQGVQAFLEVQASDLTICVGEVINYLAAGNAAAYVWDFGDGSPEEQGLIVSHDFPDPGVYEVTLIGSDTSSCNLSDTAVAIITVIATPLIVPQFDAVPASSCDGYAVEYFNLSTGGTQYLWDLGDGTSSSATNPVHPYTGPGEYTVSLRVSNAVCPDTLFTTNTIIIPPATLSYEPDPAVALCDGQSTTLDAGAGFDSYLWSTGEITRLLLVAAPGTYGITVTDGLCTSSGEIIVEQGVVHPPIADVFTCLTTNVTLTPSFVPQQILWNTGSTVPTLLVDQQGIYWFDAIDAFGCPVTDTVSVLIAELAEGVASIPNVFTPNGDGKNDTFQVQGLAIDEFNMEVFNRWGQKIYESSSSAKGWNGGLDNGTGSPAPDGTYYYVIDLRDQCSNAPKNTFKGHVTLLR